VIDDESAIVEELVEFLNGEGITATAAGDAPSAIRQIEQAPPGAITVILTDVRMPGEDGLSLARDILGSSCEANAVEVIIMSGHCNAGMAIDALRSRVFDFIRKPLLLTELAEIVRRAHASATARRRHCRASSGAPARPQAEAAPLSALLGMVSVALHRPLASVLGLAGLIETAGGALPPAQLAEYAGLIRKAGERLTGLTEAMRKVAELEAGALPGQKQPLSVREVVSGLARGHAAEAREHGQTIDARLPPDIIVTTDSHTLSIALDQLVTNAIRFGPKGQTVRIEAASAGGDVTFRVIDAGSGMTGPELAELRQPFEGSGMVLTRANGGLALGLFLAERAVAALGGRLELKSAPGQGTAAAVVLPATPPSPG
jgi:signal transduction histidine kinase